ncbi:MAG: TadE/TadG family type IV pilus assembly protein [Bdellovibrionota bacterium]|nr:pilus assembly protein [Deltaproteobacteria bacterium]
MPLYAQSNQNRLKKAGQASLELALLFPLLFLLFFGGIQIIIYIQSATAVQYAAFSSARAFQVYGDRKLADIGYRKIASHPKTNADQTIAEAAAEMVIFESLMWEQSRIDQRSSLDIFNRVYEDGNDLSYNRGASYASGGAVKVNLHCAHPGGCENGEGVTVTYCMPFVFPGVDLFFAAREKEYPCKVQRFGRSYNGVALSKSIFLGREPLER